MKKIISSHCIPLTDRCKMYSNINNQITFLIFLVVFLLFNSGFLLNAQDSKSSTPAASIAFAYPVDNITVDGDRSDWPEKTIKYPISNVFGKKPVSSDDFSGYFMSAYNLKEQALYFVAVVSDDSHIIDTSKNAGTDTQDTYSLYLDSRNSPSGSGVVSWHFNEIWKSISNPADSWDPEVKNASWNNVLTACKHKGSETVYEFRIILKDGIWPGRSVGVDQSLTDKDAGDDKKSRSTFSWGAQQDKDSSPLRLGYLILMKAGEQTETITGKIKWENPAIKGLPSRIRIMSATRPALWVQVPVDSTGNYSAALPRDTYEISPLWSFRIIGNDYNKIDRKISKVSVKSRVNSLIEAPLLVFKTIAAPDLLPEKGILFDFDASRSFLIDDFVKQYQEYYEIPGVSLAIIKNGEVIYHKTYGVKNTYTREPVDDNTLFEAASITKTVFAFAVNSLAEKGIIDLDKPLYQYLPFEAVAHDEMYKLMTARHVLSHQTGLPNWADENPDSVLNLKFTPGTAYGYSGEGFEYLKRVVARITGKDILTVLDEEVIKPLGLKNVYFEKNEYLAKVVSNGHYENFPQRSILPDSPGMAWSMHTEALSFSTYVLALLNRKVLKPETYDEMFRFQSTIPLDEEEKKQGLELYYGLGFELEKTPFGFVFEHGGNNGDFKCQFKIFRDLKMGFIIFTNSNTGGKLAYDDMTKFLITGRGVR